MTLRTLIGGIVITGALGGCGHGGGSQPTACFAATNGTCTTTENQYSFSKKRSESVERHWGCSSWSGSSCSHWIDSDNQRNQGVISNARGMHDYMQKGSSSQTFGANPSPGFGQK